VVSRAIFEEMRRTGTTNVFLDITFKSKEYLENRFPNIYKTCLGYGIDISKDYIPVAPAEHYCMGGIRTDVYGRTAIDGLYSCGEVACNGIHGANRLASNSLLEGLVFGHKIGSEIMSTLSNKPKIELEFALNYLSDRVVKDFDRDVARKEIQEVMTENVGIIRNKSGLLVAKGKIDKYYNMIENSRNENIKDYELQNIILLCKMVIKSALEREESRGAHYRSDYNKTDDEKWLKNIIRKRGSN
jgi:L-aspartate oxidase